MSKDISQEEYVQLFDKGKAKDALEHALEIRKFEIELYWKRATYFWTFIGATFAAFFVVQASAIISETNKTDLSVVLSCLGITLSSAWFFVNKGSKQWQENWENHVDMLEDDVIGPLYKIVLKRPEIKGFALKKRFSNFITGPASFSVSKINQIISFYIMILWAILLYNSLPEFSLSKSINLFYVAIIGLTILTCLSFIFCGRTNEKSHVHKATKRVPTIINPPNDKQSN